MRRVFWIALGATAGVLIVRKLTRVADNITPAGAAERVTGALGGLGQAVRDFSDDVKAAMAERDVELRHALGIDADGAAAGNGRPDLATVDHLLHPDTSRGTF